MIDFSNFGAFITHSLNLSFIVHLTHFVWLSYLGKLSNLKITNYRTVDIPIATTLRYFTCKNVSMIIHLLIIQIPILQRIK